jgi:hypothetical protein
VPNVGVGVQVDFGLAQRPLAGVKVGAGFRRGPLSLGGTLRWDPRATVTTTNRFVGTAEVSTTLFVAGLAGCLHHDWHVVFAGCIVGEVGRIQRSAGGGQLGAFEQADVYAAGGAEARAEVRLPARFNFYLAADLLAARKLGAVSTNASTGMTSAREVPQGLLRGLVQD